MGDYVSQAEDRLILSALIERIEQDLPPRNFIERLWLDEFVMLEWELHRLRSAKKAVIERHFADALTGAWIAEAGIPISEEDREQFAHVPAAAQGDMASFDVIQSRLGDDAVRPRAAVVSGAYVDDIDIHLNLERTILACSQRRDAILMKLSFRREFMALQAGRLRAPFSL